MSGYPIRRDIVLRGERASLVNQKDFHRRLEVLFNVHVNFTTTGEPVSSKFIDRSEGGELVVKSDTSNGWVTVRGNSEEDCLKTQRYVVASSQPDFKVLVPCGPQLLKFLFEDTPALRDNIEREYAVLIVGALKDGGLYIQGEQSQVSMAVDRVHRLADTMPVASQQPKLYQQPPCDGSYHPSHTTKQPHSFNSTTTTTTHQSMLPPSTQPGVTVPAALDSKLIIRGDLTSDNHHAPYHTDSSLMRHQPVPPTDTRPSTVPHSTTITGDVKLHKRVNQYVQLGFPVQQVQSVMESLGPSASENDIMSRLVLVKKTVQPSPVVNPVSTLSKEGLRPIVIDGSNVAMKHGNGKYFSCKGIQIALNYFLARGHKEVTIFVPQWRKEPSRPETPIRDQEILFQLESAGYVKLTPSRRFGSRKIVSYDDRFIVQLAYDKGGIIVSDDNFRDLFEENPLWRETIEKRVLQFVFVEDSFMVPQDPLGKHGPHLDVFLRGISPNRAGDSGPDQYNIPKDETPCPYKEKCTFGPRCRYYHPEREMKKREKEAQEEVAAGSSTTNGGTNSNGPSVSGGDSSWYRTTPTGKEQQPQSKDEQQQLYIMNNLSIKSDVSPRKVVHATYPYLESSSERPGGLRHTHPIVGPPAMSHSGPSLGGPNDRGVHPYSPHSMSHDQWNSGRPHKEDSKVMGTMARGSTDRHTPLTMSPSPYNHSYQPPPHQHVQPRPCTHPHVTPHLPMDYHHPHYSSMQHPPPHLHGNEHSGFPANMPGSSRPHSANMVGYSNTAYSQHYKDTREFDQLQSLDSNQKMIFEKSVERYPQHRERILALITNYGLSDLNTVIKALGK